MSKTIRVDDATHAGIEAIALWRETNGQVVARLLNLYHLLRKLPISNPAETLVTKVLTREEPRP